MTKNIKFANFHQSLLMLMADGNTFYIKLTKLNAIFPWNAMYRQPYMFLILDAEVKVILNFLILFFSFI